MGQFRTAGGLVLLSGRTLGPQMFLPLARLARSRGKRGLAGYQR
jgi:hypothetical protein